MTKQSRLHCFTASWRRRYPDEHRGVIRITGVTEARPVVKTDWSLSHAKRFLLWERSWRVRS
jgi:hypothetical protein